jgi:hypothetical protein
MDRILISSLIGFTTYMVLKAYSPDKKNEKSDGQSPTASFIGGAKKKADKDEKKSKKVKENKEDEQYPLCFEICPVAQKVFNELKKEGKEETLEFKDINRLYSRILCLEMALGNNDYKKVQDNKVMKELERYRSYYNMEDVENVNRIINDTFNKAEKLIKKISDKDSLIKKNKEMYEMHTESIMKLLKKFLQK